MVGHQYLTTSIRLGLAQRTDHGHFGKLLGILALEVSVMLRASRIRARFALSGAVALVLVALIFYSGDLVAFQERSARIKETSARMHAEETVEKLKQLNNQLTTSLEKFSRSTLNVELSSPPTSTLEEPTPATLAKSSSIETSPLGVNPEQLSKLVGSVSHNTEALIGQTTELSNSLASRKMQLGLS